MIWVAIEKHKLSRDSVGVYGYNNVVSFLKNIKGVLEDKYFETVSDGITN